MILVLTVELPTNIAVVLAMTLAPTNNDPATLAFTVILLLPETLAEPVIVELPVRVTVLPIKAVEYTYPQVLEELPK